MSARIASFAAFLVLLALWITPQPVCAQYAEAESPPDQYRDGFESVSEDETKEWLSILASPDFAGRATGHSGYAKAAHWVSGKLAEFGWAPIGDNGTYFQNVPLTRIRPDMEASFISGPNGVKICGEKDLAFTSRSAAAAAVTGKVVFVNAHGEKQELPDDLSLQKKVVVLVEKEAGYGFLRQIWKKRPAVIIRVTQAALTSRTRIVLEGSPSSKPTRIDAAISEQAALKLAEAVGAEAALAKPREEEGLAIEEGDAELTVEVKYAEEPLRPPNVVAWFEGSDPDVKHEYVTIGAHLDHLGLRGGEAYLGADDNASGTTAILQIAQAVSISPNKPRRSVLFIAFAAEELGLIGSKYYCEHPLKPLKDMVCMLNLDMVGRNEESDKEPAEENEDTLHLVGSKKTAIGLHDMMVKANRHVNFKIEYDQEKRVFHRSDHASFNRKGIPVAFLFAGFHTRYHRPTDTLEGINYHKIVSAARLGYLASMMAAEHGHFERNKETEEKTSAAVVIRRLARLFGVVPGQPTP